MYFRFHLLEVSPRQVFLLLSIFFYLLPKATASLPPMVLPFTEMDLVKSRTLMVLIYHVIDGDRLSMPPLHESTSTTAVMSQSKDVLQFHDKDYQRRTE